MTAARKLWTDEHQRQLKGARLEAGVSDVAFARDNAIALRHLQQLEEGGSSAFYSESIKYDMGAKLLKRLGVEPHSTAAVQVETTPDLAPAAPLAPSMPAETPADTPSTPAPSPMASPAHRTPYILLSLVGVGLIGAAISLIPSIHQPGATQGVLQVSGAAPAAEPVSPDRTQDAVLNAGSSAQPDSASASTVSAPAIPMPTAAAAPAGMVMQPTMAESCRAEGTPQTIVPSQPSKSADYVYVTAVSEVSLCVRDAAGQVTRKSLQAGQSLNIPGKQPFDVTADKLDQLRVFFQGQRIWFQAEATRLRLTAATATD